MTAESAHDSYHNTQPHEQSDPPAAGEAILIQIHEHVQERRRSAKEREMFNGFVTYCQEHFGVDPRTQDPAHSETIALGAHGFLANVLQRRIDTLKKISEDAGQPMPQVYAIPPAPVERTIHWYYREFGYTRRSKSDKIRAKEEVWLNENKRPIYASVREGGDFDEEGNQTPMVKVPRASYFQELGLGIELEKVLRAQRYEVAADGVETLLAAYGSWFPQRINDTLQNRRGIMRTSERDSHNIYRINDWDIPEDFRAEHPRYSSNT